MAQLLLCLIRVGHFDKLDLLSMGVEYWGKWLVPIVVKIFLYQRTLITSVTFVTTTIAMVSCSASQCHNQSQCSIWPNEHFNFYTPHFNFSRNTMFSLNECTHLFIAVVCLDFST